MKGKYLRLADAILALVRRGKPATAGQGKSPKNTFRALYLRLPAAKRGGQA